MKIIPVQNSTSKLHTGPLKKTKNWMQKLCARFLVPLNESAHRKVDTLRLTRSYGGWFLYGYA